MSFITFVGTTVCFRYFELGLRYPSTRELHHFCWYNSFAVHIRRDRRSLTAITTCEIEKGDQSSAFCLFVFLFIRVFVWSFLRIHALSKRDSVEIPQAAIATRSSCHSFGWTTCHRTCRVTLGGCVPLIHP